MTFKRSSSTVVGSWIGGSPSLGMLVLLWLGTWCCCCCSLSAREAAATEAPYRKSRIPASSTATATRRRRKFQRELQQQQAVPVNDACEQAVGPLEPSNNTVIIIEDSTVGATNEAMGPCGDAFKQTSPGVWYTVLGNGQPVRVSTCVDDWNNTSNTTVGRLTDTQIKVYTGSSCDALQCLAGNDDDPELAETCNGASGVTWNTVEGQLYYVLIDAYINDDVGEFALQLATVAATPTPTGPNNGTLAAPPTTVPTMDPSVEGTVMDGPTQLPANDICETAIGPLSTGVVVQGSTVGATNDATIECESARDQESGGVWYTFVGHGKRAKATTCHGDDAIPDTDFDTQIKVYTTNTTDNSTSSSCDALTCVAGNDDDYTDTCGSASGAEWDTVEGEIYYILVHGFGLLTEGTFGLLIAEAAAVTTPPTFAPLAPPENDACDTAYEPLAVGDVVEGLTISATNDNATACGKAPAQVGPGVWYTAVGTGGRLAVSTCTESGIETAGSVLSVFRGSSCGELECVTGASVDLLNPDCAGGARTSWQSVTDEFYYILVHSQEQDTYGYFTLSFDEVPVNDVCEEAIALSINSIVQGTTESASNDYAVQCGNIVGGQEAGGVWYSVQAENGGFLIATTCTGNPDHDNDFISRVTVYTGSSCDTLECVAGNGDDVTDTCNGQGGVVFQATEGETYYLLVHGSVDNATDFHFVVRESEPVPTLSPTGVPPNDLCEDATGPLPIGSIVHGSTFAATPDGAGQCGAAANQTAPGVWYTVVGTGSVIKASTCTGYPNLDENLDNQVSVYRGGCDALACVASSHEDYTQQECVGAASAVWTSEPGELYHVLVHGITLTKGPFILLVRETPPNDFCQKPTGPLQVGSITKGTTSGASIDGLPACGKASYQTAPGVWYSVLGTGGPLLATTCTAGVGSEFDTQIAIYTGECTFLDCVNGNDDGKVGSCFEEAAAIWESEIDVLYLIFVHGFQSQAGSFSLVVQETTLPPTMAPTGLPKNDFCEDAIGPLVPGQVVRGSTIGTTNDDTGSCGDARLQNSNGVWYTYVGGGMTVKASTCVDEPDLALASFDTQIKIYSGNCSALECVAGNDDDETDTCDGKKSGVLWTTVPGKVYYILVHGFSEGEGRFGLLLTETSAPPTAAPLPNDECDGAIGPLPLDTIVEAKLDGATKGNAPSCGFATEQMAPGVWYIVEVEESRNLVATTCTGNPDHDVDLDLQVSVFRSSCDALECVAGNDDNVLDGCKGEGSVGWPAEGGETYRVLVHGAAPTAVSGAFYLVVRETTELPPTASPTGIPANDVCEDAFGPLAIGSFRSGSTAAATVDRAAPACGNATQPVSPGVWYTVIGTGATIKASTCTNYPLYDDLFDSQISVYKSGCNVLECVAGNDVDMTDKCNEAAGAVWTTEPDEVYHVLVHGGTIDADDEVLKPANYSSSSSKGRFVLTIRETPSNDLCSNALPLEFDSVAVGTTTGSGSEDALACGDAPEQTSPGVWYSVVGNGADLIANTVCIDEYNLPTQISIFRRSSNGSSCMDEDGLECVDGHVQVDATGSCSETAGSIQWEAMENETYFILVHGVSSQTGTFALVVRQATAAPTAAPTAVPPNDVCETAVPLTLDKAVAGSTGGATNDESSACGTAIEQTSPGVWYTFQGTGTRVKVTTCHKDAAFGNSNFDTQLKVYTTPTASNIVNGSCTLLECIDGNDDDANDDCAVESGVQWDSVKGQLYYLLVHGWGGGTGPFGIVVRSAK